MKYFIFYKDKKDESMEVMRCADKKLAITTITDLKFRNVDNPNFSIWKVIRGEEIDIQEQTKISFAKKEATK